MISTDAFMCWPNLWNSIMRKVSSYILCFMLSVSQYHMLRYITLATYIIKSIPQMWRSPQTNSYLFRSVAPPPTPARTTLNRLSALPSVSTEPLAKRRSREGEKERTAKVLNIVREVDSPRQGQERDNIESILKAALVVRDLSIQLGIARYSWPI